MFPPGFCYENYALIGLHRATDDMGRPVRGKGVLVFVKAWTEVAVPPTLERLLESQKPKKPKKH